MVPNTYTDTYWAQTLSFTQILMVLTITTLHPTTFIYISPPTFFYAYASHSSNHLKPRPLFPYKNPLHKEKKRISVGINR